MRRLFIFLLVLSLLLGGLYVGRVPILTWIGASIMEEDSVEKADAIVMLNGAFPRDVLGASALYHKGVAKKILFVRERQGMATEELLKRKVKIPERETTKRSALLQLGVPAKAIEVLEGSADGTLEEANVLKRYLADHPNVHRLVFVTRRPHTRRAKKVLRSILSPRAEVFIVAAAEDPIHAGNWWKDTWAIYEVSNEFMKSLYQTLSGYFPLPQR